MLRCAPTQGLRRMIARAEFELSRLHRRELGRLYSGAALLLQREQLAGDEQQRPLQVPPLRCELYSLGEWRDAARQVLELIGSRDRNKPIVQLLASMLARPVDSWLSPVLLAALGARLAPGRAARLAEAQVLSAAGRHSAAQERLAQLINGELSSEESWRVLMLLGRCHLAAGRSLFALGALEAACEAPNCCVGALVDSLALAHVLGDEMRRCRAAARLDLVVETGDPEFRAAMADLRRRVETGGFPATLESSGSRLPASPAERVLALIGS